MAIRWIVNSLLVAALVAAFAGRGAVAAERIPEEQAIAEIQKLGGEVTLDEKSPGKPVIAVRFGAPGQQPGGQQPGPGGQQSGIAGQKLGVGSRRWLRPEESPVTDAGLVHLKGLTNLQKLDLSITAVTDAGLVHLKGLTQLQMLSLVNTTVTDAGLVHLKGMTQLQTLYLGGAQAQITEAGVNELRKALPNCGLAH